MKNAIKLTLAVVLMLGSTSLFAQKFGRINSNEIITAMPEMKEAETNLEAFGKTLQESIEAISVEYQNKLQEYQKNYETLSEAIRDMKAKELQDLSARAQQYQQAAQQDFQRKQNELMAPIVEKAEAAIKKVAAAGGFIAIFDTAQPTLAYFDEAQLTDIAPAVRTELGITATPEAAAAPAPAAQQ